ncbi:GL12509 [Drosophila persimilis]|uniref:GL12509 n=1 Tax=Drosophila persimilis TaxID=7234 RepID=B4H3H0_DROPE|nr:GL12509 [Drosophila persimilis]
MRIQIWVLTLLLGLLCAQALETNAKSDSTSSIGDSKSAASTPLESEASKDKRQVSSKETPLYPNHRSADPAAADDPEDGQETIYGTKPNQFIIRPIAPHQHQQHEGHQEPQLRNFAAANSRPHAAQLLEQSQEVSGEHNRLIDGVLAVRDFAVHLFVCFLQIEGRFIMSLLGPAAIRHQTSEIGRPGIVTGNRLQLHDSLQNAGCKHLNIKPQLVPVPQSPRRPVTIPKTQAPDKLSNSPFRRGQETLTNISQWPKGLFSEQIAIDKDNYN